MVIPCCYAGEIRGIVDDGPLAARVYKVFFPIDGDEEEISLPNIWVRPKRTDPVALVEAEPVSPMVGDATDAT